MTFRNRWLFIVFIIISIAGLLNQWRVHQNMVDGYDMPRQLSVKIDTLNLIHVQRNCDCPEWIEASRFKNPKEVQKEDYIYIEAANADVALSSTGPIYTEAGYQLRLQGSFYVDSALPVDLVQHGNQKPEKARVFRYIASDLIKPE